MTGVRDGFPILVGARRYEVNVEGITWQTIQPTRQGSDQGAGPGEQSLSMENIWRRTRDNWILGAGQDYADLLEQESSSLRFRSSDGIDPFTKRALTPLHTVETLLASANTNLQVLSMRVSSTDYLVIVDGTSIYYCSNPTAGSPTLTAHTGLSGSNILSITTDGQKWWACDGANVFSGVPGTAAVTTLSTTDADMVGYANGRLLASDGHILFEVSSTGTFTTLFTHTNTAFVWTGVASSPAGIYAFGSVGDRSEVYVITAIDATGALDIPFVACDMPQGELVRAMCSYAGVMLVATSRGLRLAVIQGGGFLVTGPVIDEPGDVRCLEPQLEDVWFGWTYTSAINGLGRARLSRFTEDLVPSFATDLMARGTVSGTVTSVCTVGTRRYFCISGRGTYRETGTYETTSTIDLGWFTYGISEEKVLDTLTVWCDALPASCSIVANVYPDDSAVALATLTMNTAAQTKETVGYSGSTKAERLRVVLTITQSGSTPVTVRRVTLRSSPTPFIAELIVLPLYLSDAVRTSENQVVGQDPYEEWTYLQGLKTSRARIPLGVGDYSATARLESIDVEKGGLGGGNGLEGWADGRSFVAGPWDCTFMTVEPSG